MKFSAIDAYFKRKNVEVETSSELSNPIDQLNSNDRLRKSSRIKIKRRIRHQLAKA